MSQLTSPRGRQRCGERFTSGLRRLITGRCGRLTHASARSATARSLGAQGPLGVSGQDDTSEASPEETADRAAKSDDRSAPGAFGSHGRCLPSPATMYLGRAGREAMKKRFKTGRRSSSKARPLEVLKRRGGNKKISWRRDRRNT